MISLDSASAEGGIGGNKKMFYHKFYIGRLRVEIRKVRFARDANRKFLFFRWEIKWQSEICKKCRHGNKKYLGCRQGIPQTDKKSCYYFRPKG